MHIQTKSQFSSPGWQNSATIDWILTNDLDNEPAALITAIVDGHQTQLYFHNFASFVSLAQMMHTLANEPEVLSEIGVSLGPEPQPPSTLPAILLGLALLSGTFAAGLCCGLTL